MDGKHIVRQAFDAQRERDRHSTGPGLSIRQVTAIWNSVSIEGESPGPVEGREIVRQALRVRDNADASSSEASDGERHPVAAFFGPDSRVLEISPQVGPLRRPTWGGVELSAGLAERATRCDGLTLIDFGGVPVYRNDDPDHGVLTYLTDHMWVVVGNQDVRFSLIVLRRSHAGAIDARGNLAAVSFLAEPSGWVPAINPEIEGSTTYCGNQVLTRIDVDRTVQRWWCTKGGETTVSYKMGWGMVVWRTGPFGPQHVMNVSLRMSGAFPDLTGGGYFPALVEATGRSRDGAQDTRSRSKGVEPFTCDTLGSMAVFLRPLRELADGMLVSTVEATGEYAAPEAVDTRHALHLLSNSTVWDWPRGWLAGVCSAAPRCSGPDDPDVPEPEDDDTPTIEGDVP